MGTTTIIVFILICYGFVTMCKKIGGFAAGNPDVAMNWAKFIGGALSKKR